MAVSDPTGTIVRPLPVIQRIASPAGAARLNAVIAAEAPDLIVVGEPRLLSGEQGTQARTARRFAQNLQKHVKVPVEMFDERLTTVEAGRRRSEGGSRAEIDSLAACVLLEAFLASR